jgi:hypothetical protein
MTKRPTATVDGKSASGARHDIKEASMTTYNGIIRGARPWQGVLDPAFMADDMISAGHKLADAAKVGDWPTVMEVLDGEWKWLVINQWRPGGDAWFTVLHQAAWHGAPKAVVGELLERGALRSLRDSKGRTAYDVAVARGHRTLIGQLLQPPRSPLAQAQIRSLDARLAELIAERIHGRVFDGDLRRVLRHPPVEILPELPGERVFFPMPAQYGFHIALQRGALEVKSWCGLVEGSGQTHLVTPEGSVLVDQGFV